MCLSYSPLWLLAQGDKFLWLQNSVIQFSLWYLFSQRGTSCFIDVANANSLSLAAWKEKKNEYCPLFLTELLFRCKFRGKSVCVTQVFDFRPRAKFMCLQNPVIPSASRYVIYSAKGICFMQIACGRTKRKKKEWVLSNFLVVAG